MKILIRDNISLSLEVLENFNYEITKNKILYKKENEEYIWTILENKLILERVDSFKYTNTFVKGKLTKSLISVDNMTFDIYIITKDLQIDEKNIFLSYNIYSDREVENLISSYDVNIVL